MSRNVLEKLAKNEDLDEADVQYAIQMGYDLPEKYSDKVEAHKAAFDTFGRPNGMVVQGGSFPSADNSGPGLFLGVEELESLTKDQLSSLADVKGLEVSGTKAEMVAQLSGTDASEEVVEAEDEEDAGQG